MGRQKHGSARLIQDGYHGCHRGQSYISQIENGQKQLVSLLTDYAQEVGAQIKYVVDPAEKKPKVIGFTSLGKSQARQRHS